MRKPAFYIILCLLVSLGLWPSFAFAQHGGGGGHGGGGFSGGGGFHGGGGGFHGSVSGGSHGGGYSAGGSHAYGGYRGGAYYGARGYYGGRGYGYGYRGYPGYGYGYRGGYGYGRYWGYPGYGWGWGYPYWGWGFGLGWGWPYWWGYPYGYSYGYPYSYYSYPPDSQDCTPGYNCPDNNGGDDPPRNPNFGAPLYQGPNDPAPQRVPVNPSRPSTTPPPATTVPQNYAPSNAPSSAPSDDSGAPIVSVDHIMATPSSYRVVHTNLASTQLSPKMQNAVQHLGNMPPFAREREIETGRYSHFTTAEKQVLRNVP